jgi:hypothetical protein
VPSTQSSVSWETVTWAEASLCEKRGQARISRLRYALESRSRAKCGASPRFSLSTILGPAGCACAILAAAWFGASIASADMQVVLGPEETLGRGYSCDIAVDHKTGEPHIIWEDLEGHLLHSRRAEEGWQEPERIEVGLPVGATAVHRAGAVAMTIGPDGGVHACFIANNGIYHVRQTEGGWSEPTLICQGTDQVGLAWPSLVGTSDGQLHVIFERGHHAHHCHFDGANWSSPQRIDRENVSSHAWDIIVDSDGNPHLVFHARRGENSEGYYATMADGEWRVTRITEEEHWVDCPGLAIDPDGKFHVVWTILEEVEAGRMKYSELGEPHILTGDLVPVETQAHNFTRLLCDARGILYAFLPRRFPPKLVVRAEGGWLPVVALGGEKQGFWFLEADVHGTDVHAVYSCWRQYETITPITYRTVTCEPE